MNIVTLKVEMPSFTDNLLSELDEQLESKRQQQQFTMEVNKVADKAYAEVFDSAVAHFSKYAEKYGLEIDCTIVGALTNGVAQRAFSIPMVNGYNFMVLLQPLSENFSETNLITYGGKYRWLYGYWHSTPNHYFPHGGGGVGTIQRIEASFVDRLKNRKYDNVNRIF